MLDLDLDDGDFPGLAKDVNPDAEVDDDEEEEEVEVVVDVDVSSKGGTGGGSRFLLKISNSYVEGHWSTN